MGLDIFSVQDIIFTVAVVVLFAMGFQSGMHR